MNVCRAAAQRAALHASTNTREAASIRRRTQDEGVSISAPPSAGWKVAARDLHLPLYSALGCCRQLKLAPGRLTSLRSHFLRLTQLSGVGAQVKTRTAGQLGGVLSTPRFGCSLLAARRIDAPLMRSSICHIMSHELTTATPAWALADEGSVAQRRQKHESAGSPGGARLIVFSSSAKDGGGPKTQLLG